MVHSARFLVSGPCAWRALDFTWRCSRRLAHPRAGHCKRLAEDWGKLGTAFKEDPKIHVAHVDCTVEKDICSKYEVRDPDPMNRSTRSLPFRMRPPSLAAHLSGFFDAILCRATRQAPWVPGRAGPLRVPNARPHSANPVLLPSFPQQALQRVSTSRASTSCRSVAAAGSSQQLATLQIRGYPTLKVIANGSEVKAYKGARDLEKLTDFLKETAKEALSETTA